MKPQHIQVLVAIAEHGSLRAAAKHLDKSQPALTQSLRQAEQELGVSVFSRTSRGVELTEIGERILVRARTIASEIERLDEEVAQLRGEQVGAVNVCLSPLAAMRIMPRALTLFRKTHPNIEVRLSSGLFPGAIKPLREGRIDLLIGPEPPIGMTRELTIEHLIDTPIQVVTSDSSPLLKARSLGELAEAQWIMIGAPTGPGDIFRQPFVDHGLTPPMALTTSEILLRGIVAGRKSGRGLYLSGAVDGRGQTKLEHRTDPDPRRDRPAQDFVDVAGGAPPDPCCRRAGNVYSAARDIALSDNRDQSRFQKHH
ncbi:LysR substrate-binding domain-containing protein [Phaeobacter sp. J2-8]|uniref:LysR family transcriptional regulator n=1 Tax=Phaeobacter sp. J2-8 TaxID=2931394 RepID=UPI001FD33573|nr:LysR substrate-binding domain-containing protein [Phaeobacter sp. J2-8]MCJ7873248.1 LysR substrate-binding domain-containing protein [Phaeobacter sp. J2-8]